MPKTVLGESKREGDPCPKCGTALVRVPLMFKWRGEYAPGAVCRPCDAMWAMEGEEIEPLKLAREPVNDREDA